MKFIFNTIIWALASFMIFFHQFVGKDYFLIIGMTVLFISILRGCEKGISLSHLFFSLFLFVTLGTGCQAIYLYRNIVLDQLDQVLLVWVHYAILYSTLGIIAFVVNLYKVLVSTFHNVKDEKITLHNHNVYMNNSEDNYNSKNDEKIAYSKVAKVCDILVLTFIVVTTYGLYFLKDIGFKSEMLSFETTQTAAIIICSCWFASLVYFFNGGLKIIFYALIIHLIVSVICSMFGYSLVGVSVFTSTGITLCILSLAYLFLPAILIFALQETGLITSFRDY